MSDKFFSPGAKVELHQIVDGTSHQDDAKCYISQINEIFDAETLDIMMPMEKGKLILLPLNSKYRLVSVTGQGLYECNVKVIDRYKSGRVYLQALKIISEIKKYQRREYYRHSCSIPIKTRRLEEHEIESMIWDQDMPGKDGLAIDIGGGGIRFLTEQEYQLGEDIISIVKLEFDNGVKEIQALGKVLSTKEVAKGHTKKEVRVQFELISNVAREDIIQFIFEDERRRRKKDSWH